MSSLRHSYLLVDYQKRRPDQNPSGIFFYNILVKVVILSIYLSVLLKKTIGATRLVFVVILKDTNVNITVPYGH